MFLPLWLLNVQLQQPGALAASAAVAVTRPGTSTRSGANRLAMRALPLAAAYFPPEPVSRLVPQPKQMSVYPEDPLVLEHSIEIDPPGSAPFIKRELKEAILSRWQVPDLHVVEGRMPTLFLRVQNLALPAEGYEIRVNRKNAFILGQDLAGLRHAVSTMAQLMFVKDGKLCLPSTIIRDWPAIGWRGVHLFVGPEALQFHRQLWDRVLLPLKFNEVVLECERTAWHALPSAPAGYMTRDDLSKLFSYYRGIGVDPIPLIQSFGHMDWLLSDKDNLNLALYKNVSSSIDPRLEKAKDILRRVWDEAILQLRPKAIHVGLDEVSAKWPTPNPSLMTALWQLQIGNLSQIASNHRVGFMCWGDQCLGPGEAIDANLAETRDEAKLRRHALPQGSWVADWHYRNDPNPERFNTSLQLWRSEGVTPIAATWFRPENIRGFYLAAAAQGAGTLQTTWAGKDSNERNMLREFRQFSAMVVAADYAWTGRKDDCNNLGYDPAEVFRRMYFSGPSPLTPSPGTFLTANKSISARIGEIAFNLFDPVSLPSSGVGSSPVSVEIQTEGLQGSHLALAVDSTSVGEENRVVGSVQVFTSAGEIVKDLVYGQNMRASSDSKGITSAERNNGLSAVMLDLGHAASISRIIFTQRNGIGLRLHGATAF